MRYWTGERISALIAVMLAAACLRPAIVSFGPLATRIGDDLGLTSTMLGLLAAMPILAFATVSMFVSRIAARFGFARTTLVALLILAAGTALRLAPPPAALWIGTALVGVGIATLNVLLPAIVKQRFSTRVSFMTGVYSSVMIASAGTFVALAPPIAIATGGNWRLALAASLPIVIIAAIAAAFRVRSDTTTAQRAAKGGPSPWRSPLAWAVTAYMGLQSTFFYAFANWMPTIEQAAGFGEVETGVHFSIAQIIGVPFGFAATAFMQRMRDHRPLAAGSAALGVIPIIGALLAPGLMPVWTITIGILTGIAFPVALALIVERAGSTAEAARLSGMAQSTGYLFAAGGPVLAGWLFQVTGTWTATLILFLVLMVALTVAGWFAGVDRTISGGQDDDRGEDAADGPGAQPA